MSKHEREYQENTTTLDAIELLVWSSRLKVKIIKEEEINLVFKKE